jgi:hypothetical protein
MTYLPQTPSPVPALLIAHPGHECILHGWLQAAQPRVYILSDGAGGDGTSRIAFSRALVEAAGADPGSVFGPFSDQRWYRAMLDGDLAFFLEPQAVLAQAVSAFGITELVCDPVDHYNPLHDLANAIAHGIANQILVRENRTLTVWTYPLMGAANLTADGGRTITLDPDQNMKKLDAMAAYHPLALEVEARRAALELPVERLIRDGDGFGWPPLLEFTPEYETVGLARIEKGQYDDLITYRHHVRPIAQALFNANIEACLS